MAILFVIEKKISYYKYEDKFMKFKKLLLVIPALALTGCDFDFFGLFKKDLVIPNVDVESLEISLPALPSTRNMGAIKEDGDYDVIDLYQLSDFHGAVNYEQHSNGDYIGLAKLASYFEGKRNENPGGTILLSSGDMFQGSAESNLTRGYMVNYCMQYMGFDAMAIGNHEFDWTDEWLQKNAELKYNTSSMPFLGANILKDGARPSFIQEYTVVTRGEYKIGVIGTMGADLEYSILKSAIAGYEFVPYADLVSNLAATLKASESCDAVVLLCHDKTTSIESVTGVDAVFAGHAHVDARTSSTAKSVPTLATKNYGQSVAHIALKFDKNTKALSLDKPNDITQMSTVAASLSDNGGIKNIMDQYAPAINQIKEIKLGKADDELKYDKALKNLCTLTMYENAVEFASKNPNYNIDPTKIVAAFQNHKGGIRDNIQKGTITYGDVYRSFPFDNELVLFAINGQELRNKISNVEQYGIYRTFKEKSDLTPEETYYCVTTDYLATTDDFAGLKVLEDGDLIRTGGILRDEIAHKVYKLKTVKNSEYEKGDYHFRAL